VTPVLPPVVGLDIGATFDALWAMSPVRALLWAHIVVLLVITPVGLLSIWVERRLSGLMQARIGPNRVGPQGLLQTLADGVKLLNKEDLIPAGADRFFFQAAPVVVFISAFAMFVAMPYGPDWIPANIAVGILFVLAVGSLEAVGVIMAGWASDNKWSLLGTMRVAAQVVSYEVPLGIAALVPVLSYGTLDVQEIVRAQSGVPGLLYCFPANIVAFVVFFVAALANLKRAPFDLPEAESELVAGFHTEYSGMRFSIFFLAEYAGMFVLSAIASVLWLGGWQIPFADLAGWDNYWLRNAVGTGVIFAKASLLVGIMMWLRWTLPRLRVDQVMNLCYKFLLPLSLAALVYAAAFLTFVPSLGGW
jgi:NADH-quinone oxidoreductase subunit H